MSTLQIALTALKRLACLGNGGEYGNSIGNTIAQDAIAAIEAAPTPWTNVKDALPPEETPVLILHCGKPRIGQRVWDYPGYEDTYKAYWYWDDPEDDRQDWDNCDITHWMPLPAAPATAPSVGKEPEPVSFLDGVAAHPSYQAKCDRIREEFGDTRAAHARQQALEEAAQYLEQASLEKIENPHMQVFIGQLMMGIATHLRSMK